ncbi:hypothetical protein [Actinoplanes derwentensis]|uniref:Uncharacterized protein n=1 Tax=Actinoplanes derwentensis TaxID=113562 RepID=A0A1H1R1C9_9ACTN|nr:hypothetical protein [Actinoplanes derwentensis]GID87126.1 hypothetical protein Ade03nite_60500 [Actinoplanes derwentensis]SDS29482.1 hypothetical protein SAMN04489716_0465 [Actinoplanes derwentensis]
MLRWREYREPAVVIVAGVTAVAVFSAVLFQLGDDGPKAAAPAEPVAPTEQVPIPLLSVAASPSLAPIDSIVYERVPIADTVDLAAEGTIDWVHWGEDGRYSLERKPDGAFTILEGTPSAPRNRHTASPQRFRWTGTSSVTSGISTCGAGNGFTLSAPAGPGRNTLRLYVGATNARGTLEVGLSTDVDSSATITDSWTVEGPAMQTTAYVISYRASGTGKISVKWITAASFDSTCGGVSLQAAALS